MKCSDIIIERNKIFIYHIQDFTELLSKLKELGLDFDVEVVYCG